jgi:hypothetical protein
MIAIESKIFIWLLYEIILQKYWQVHFASHRRLPRGSVRSEFLRRSSFLYGVFTSYSNAI